MPAAGAVPAARRCQPARMLRPGGAARCAGRSCCPGLAAPARLLRSLAVRPRSRGSRNEMEQQKDGEIRLPALPQQIKRWD